MLTLSIRPPTPVELELKGSALGDLAAHNSSYVGPRELIDHLLRPRLPAGDHEPAVGVRIEDEGVGAFHALLYHSHAFRLKHPRTELGRVRKRALMAFGGYAAMEAIRNNSFWAWIVLAAVIVLWALLAIVARRWMRREKDKPATPRL